MLDYAHNGPPFRVVDLVEDSILTAIHSVAPLYPVKTPHVLRARVGLQPD